MLTKQEAAGEARPGAEQEGSGAQEDGTVTGSQVLWSLG